jgi:signal peptidase I
MFVAKFVYGVRIPFTTSWLARWSTPARGEVVALRDPMDATSILVKRVVGVAGDRVRWDGSLVEMNGRPLPHPPHPDAPALLASVPDDIRSEAEEPAVLEETLDARRYPILVASDTHHPPGEVVVPPAMVFLLGDMRARSRDSRLFGPVSVDAVLGRAAIIWASCAAPLFGAQWFCDPRTIRWRRLLRPIH